MRHSDFRFDTAIRIHLPTRTATADDHIALADTQLWAVAYTIAGGRAASRCRA